MLIKRITSENVEHKNPHIKSRRIKVTSSKLLHSAFHHPSEPACRTETPNVTRFLLLLVFSRSYSLNNGGGDYRVVSIAISHSEDLGTSPMSIIQGNGFSNYGRPREGM